MPASIKASNRFSFLIAANCKVRKAALEAAAFRFVGSVGDALLPSLSIPGAFARLEPASDARTLTDDRNPIDELQVRSLEEARGRLRASL